MGTDLEGFCTTVLDPAERMIALIRTTSPLPVLTAGA